jgi:hypothetical protein
MDPKAIKLEARLSALEHMLAELFRMFYVSIGTTPEAVERTHQQLREVLQTLTVPGADPAAADLAAGELQEAYEHLLKVIMIAVREVRAG